VRAALGARYLSPPPAHAAYTPASRRCARAGGPRPSHEFEALAENLGANIGINFDPSHFWWQGIDPITVIDPLGDRIGWAHGKDTLLHPERIRRQGVLHFAPPLTDPDLAPWHFAALSEGHDDATWAALLRALRAAGYDDVVSIEHEDPRYDGEEGTKRSREGLRRALALLGDAT
jgi:sugar phosphate isomerase/epimerase